jgi:hypothetical protein
MVSVPIVEELSQNRSDRIAKHHLSKVFRSGSKEKYSEYERAATQQIRFKKEPLESIAYFWLWML